MMKPTRIATLSAVMLASAFAAAQASTGTLPIAAHPAPAGHAIGAVPHAAAGRLFAASRYAYGWRIGVPT